MNERDHHDNLHREFYNEKMHTFDGEIKSGQEAKTK